MKNILPKIGVTTGDPAGIGPEISLRAVQESSLTGTCRLVLFGSWDLLRSRAADLGIPFHFDRLSSNDLFSGENLTERSIVNIPSGDVRPGVGSAAGGEAAARNIIECTQACLRGRLDAIVTAPLNKKFFQQAGYPFPGHTEFLAHLCGVSEFAMAFLTERLRVVLATIHIPLRDVAESITPDLLFEKLQLTINEFSRFGLPCARVAVAGVNPHAGESDLLGREESELMKPGILRAREAFPQINIEGPLPADTLFWRALNGEFDVVLAMYHDQGLAPIKLVGFGESVNVTLGLPFVRASVDHGTAFDIAGKGLARHDSMVSAIRWAMRLSEGKLRTTNYE